MFDILPQALSGVNAMKWFSKKEKPRPPATRRAPDRTMERDLPELHSAGTVRNVSAGEVLFKKGENDGNVYFVVKGSFETVKEGKESRLERETFREGDWIGELLFTAPEQPRRVSTVVASEPSKVVALSQPAFKSLDWKIQDEALRKLLHRTTLRVERLDGSLEESERAKAYLTQRLEGFIRQQRRSCEESEVIRNVLDNLPRLPVYTTGIIQLLSSETASSREVSKLVKRDASLASEILKTVNSSYYGLRKTISDIHYAITYLGFNQVHQIVVSSGLRQTMPDTGAFQELHRHSIIIADLAFEICQLHNRARASTMSTIALLHDIGKGVVLLLKKQNPRLSFFLDTLEPSAISATLLRKWNIPEEVYLPIEYQNHPEFTPPAGLPASCREGASILLLAHAISNYIEDNTELAQGNPFLRDYMDSLGFSGLTLAELAENHILIDLQMKIETLPKHVREFLLAKGMRAGKMQGRAEEGSAIVQRTGPWKP